MKKKIRQLKQTLQRLCRGANTALWFSGGKDSRLLLEMILAEGLDCILLRFDDGWSKEQKEAFDTVIGRNKIAVYSWRPHSAMLFGDGDDLASVTEYSIGTDGESLPVIRDIVDGSRCSFDVKINLRRSRKPPVLIKQHIVGSKASDRHFAFGNKSLLSSETFNIGKVAIFAPLFAWTDADVLDALKTFDVGYATPSDELDTGNLAVCTKCLRGNEPVLCPKTNETIPAVDWSPEDNLRLWRERNGIEV